MLGSGPSAASGCGPTLMTAMTLGLTVAFFRQSLLHEGTPHKERAGVPSSSRLQASHTILNICSIPRAHRRHVFCKARHYLVCSERISSLP